MVVQDGNKRDTMRNSKYAIQNIFISAHLRDPVVLNIPLLYRFQPYSWKESVSHHQIARSFCALDCRTESVETPVEARR